VRHSGIVWNTRRFAGSLRGKDAEEVREPFFFSRVFLIEKRPLLLLLLLLLLLPTTEVGVRGQ
jgi:hypothetical protein